MCRSFLIFISNIYPTVNSSQYKKFEWLSSIIFLFFYFIYHTFFIFKIYLLIRLILFPLFIKLMLEKKDKKINFILCFSLFFFLLIVGIYFSVLSNRPNGLLLKKMTDFKKFISYFSKTRE